MRRGRLAPTARMGFLVAMLSILGSSSTFAQEYGGQCVRYVKNQQPKYNTSYYPNDPTHRSPVSWISAQDLYDLVVDGTIISYRNRGTVPALDCIFLIRGDAFNPFGHAGIVTSVNRNSQNRITSFNVRHSNWEQFGKELVTRGTFTFVDPLDYAKGVIYSNASGSWRTVYFLRGFVYSP